MAKIKPVSLVSEISGKLDKKELLTFYTHKTGKIFAHNNRAAGNQIPTEAQLAVRAKFAAVIALATEDMDDPIVKAQWQKDADTSGGKYSTARGAAFAFYWATYEAA